MRKVEISPSLICTDFCNLQQSIQALQALNINSLHIDILDGHFSPSMPLGLETVSQLRKVTDISFNCHLMVTNNEFFINELLAIGVQSICFHYESAFHVERMIDLIKKAGVKVGIALNPATPLHVLDCIIQNCDYVLLMLISPGYAGSKDEAMVPYAETKVKNCREYIDRRNLKTQIIVDGRVSMEKIAPLVCAGADILVAGSTSLFLKGNSLEKNRNQMQLEIEKGLAQKEV